MYEEIFGMKKISRTRLYKALKVAELLPLDRHPDTDGLLELAPGATSSGCTESASDNPDSSKINVFIDLMRMMGNGFIQNSPGTTASSLPVFGSRLFNN